MDPLVEYHKRIAREIDRSKHDWIANTPQPTMLTGGRRIRQNPLPGLGASTDGAPCTLAVGSPARRGRLIHKEKDGRFFNVGADLSGGRRRKRGFGADIARGFNSLVREVAPVVRDVGKEVGKEFLKDGIKTLVKGGRRHRYSIGDFVKDAAPVALPLMMGLGRKGGGKAKKEKAYTECVGGETTRKGGRQARNAIVQKIMKEKGLKLIEASKYVKAHNLY